MRRIPSPAPRNAAGRVARTWVQPKTGCAPALGQHSVQRRLRMPHDVRVDAWIGLLGAALGAVIVVGGQQLAGRAETSRARRAELLSSVTTLLALSEDFRNRVWEERHGLSDTAVAQWDLGAYRLAEAQVMVLLDSGEDRAVAEELRRRGADLGRHWRTQRADGPELEAAWVAHKASIEAFRDRAHQLLR